MQHAGNAMSLNSISCGQVSFVSTWVNLVYQLGHSPWASTVHCNNRIIEYITICKSSLNVILCQRL